MELSDLDVYRISDYIKSDGCTNAPDFYLKACRIHDWYYRTHIDFDETPITKDEADKRFRFLMQRESVLGRFSPMATWRWLGVKLFGHSAWHGQ